MENYCDKEHKLKDLNMEIFRATKLKSDDDHSTVHEEESEGRKQQGMNRQTKKHHD